MCLDKLTEPRLQTAISSWEVLRVISVHKLEQWTIPTWSWGERILHESLKDKYKGAFELDPSWMIKITAERSKWIDQSISHNVFIAKPSGLELSKIYFTAWESGLKTTYYLRTLGASQVEKSTLDAGKFGYTQKRDSEQIGCLINRKNEEDCESCQ